METGEGYSPLEIIHLNNFDVVINHDQSGVDKDEVEKLKVAVLKKIRDVDGVKIKDPFEDWSKTLVDDGDKTIWLDNKEKPRFVAKRKLVGTGSTTFNKWISKDRKKLSLEDSETKDVWMGANSVMNDMRGSRKIKNTVESEESLQRFKPLGIEKIICLEPVLGIIDRKTLSKIVVLPFVDGKPWIEHVTREGGNYDDENKAGVVTQDLYELLLAKGVVAGDLSRDQFMYQPKTKTLYLVDIEAFVDKKTI